MSRSPKAPVRLAVDGADDTEHLRSPAAARVAELAVESELFFFHYEHRLELPLPESLGPAEPRRAFEGGILPEPKYQAFRHDLLIGSFNPTHRAKWTAHELCHALVGFAHRPGASPFFHALAAWLAELLPVALWYFFDEAGLRRCPRHAGGGPLFRQHCAACERAARLGPLAEVDGRFLREGRGFVERELAAVTRSRREGRPLGARYATIDLASDAVAYVAAHRSRLESGLFERYAAEFFSPGGVRHEDLDALESRLLEVMEGLVEGAHVTPLAGGRGERVAQDLGYRMLTVLEETEGEARDELDRVVTRLARARSEKGIESAIEAYEGLAEEYVLPAPEDLFAVGHPLPRGYGSSIRQLTEGLRTASPSALEALGARAEAKIAEFVRVDPRVRAPLARRFADFLEGEEPAASFARFEAALLHPAPKSAETAAFVGAEGRGIELRLSPDASLVRVASDVEHEGPASEAPARAASYLVQARERDEVAVYSITEALADAVEAAGEGAVGGPRQELDELAAEGLFLALALAL